MNHKFCFGIDTTAVNKLLNIFLLKFKVLNFQFNFFELNRVAFGFSKMNLPPEIITYILGFLDLKNLLKCKYVSLYFWSLIRKMQISPLAVIQPKEQENELEQDAYCKNIGNYFASETPISSSYFLNRMTVKMFENPYFMELLSNVKKLYVDCSVVRAACINEEWFLNEFKHTHTLQINSLNQSTDDGYFNLELENLEALQVSSINLYKMKLNCPRLRAFATLDPHVSKYTFVYPEMLKELRVFKFEACMQEFVNLERICIGIGNTVDLDILKIFFNLKELKFERRTNERILAELVRRRKYSRTKPELYCLGEKIREESFQ